MCKCGGDFGNNHCKCDEISKSTPRPHAELIKAWADGAEIEHLSNGRWIFINNPGWYNAHEYRIKPKKRKILWYRNYYSATEDCVKVYQCLSECCPDVILYDNNIWLKNDCSII